MALVFLCRLSRFTAQGAAAVTGPGLNLFSPSANVLFLQEKRAEKSSPAEIQCRHGFSALRRASNTKETRCCSAADDIDFSFHLIKFGYFNQENLKLTFEWRYPAKHNKRRKRCDIHASFGMRC